MKEREAALVVFTFGGVNIDPFLGFSEDRRPPAGGERGRKTAAHRSYSRVSKKDFARINLWASFASSAASCGSSAVAEERGRGTVSALSIGESDSSSGLEVSSLGWAMELRSSAALCQLES